MRTKNRTAGHRSSCRETPPNRGGKRTGRWTLVQLSGAAVGPDVVAPALEEVLAAIPADLDWAALSDRVVPVFPRVRQHPSGSPAPLQMVVPPGLSISFGVDLGPAFLAVTRDMLATWALTPADVLATALANLERRASSISPDDIVRESIDGTPVRLLQSGTGSGASFVLLPGELGRLFGSSQQLLIAPMRDLLIALPLDADRDMVAELFDLVASQDPNSIAPIAFLFRDGRVTLDALVPGLDPARLQPAQPGPFH